MRNVIIKVSDGQTQPIIKLFSNSPNGYCRRNIIDNVRIINDYPTKHNFTGIHLLVADMHHLGNRFSNIYMNNVGIGIHLDIDDLTNGWINGNYFEHIFIDGYKYGVFFESNSPKFYGTNVNTFVDIELQSASYSEDGFKNITYIGNMFFSCAVWDTNLASSYNYTFSINSYAQDTLIISSSTEVSMNDEASDTTIMGRQGHLQIWDLNYNTSGTIDLFKDSDGSSSNYLKIFSNNVLNKYLQVGITTAG